MYGTIFTYVTMWASVWQFKLIICTDMPILSVLSKWWTGYLTYKRRSAGQDYFHHVHNCWQFNFPYINIVDEILLFVFSLGFNMLLILFPCSCCWIISLSLIRSIKNIPTYVPFILFDIIPYIVTYIALYNLKKSIFEYYFVNLIVITQKKIILGHM